MGTVFSFDVRGPRVDASALGQAVDWLHWVDATFSTYKPDSVISRLGRGELALNQCPAEVAEVLTIADAAARTSDGYFTDRPHGILDPTGVVKGWAIERASELLERAGSSSHSVNGGGDVQLIGGATADAPWRVGIAHPLRRGELIAVVTGRDLAVATSGTAERGSHIVDPHRGAAATGLASLTVVGRQLTWVDAYATAAFARGADAALSWLAGLGLAGLAVTDTGETLWTDDFPQVGTVLTERRRRSDTCPPRRSAGATYVAGSIGPAPDRSFGPASARSTFLR